MNRMHQFIHAIELWKKGRQKMILMTSVEIRLAIEATQSFAITKEE
jgi:hypothetical protein